MTEPIYHTIFRCINGKSVLDIGCGSGRLTDFLREKGLEAMGIDPHASGPGCLRASAEELPFEDSSFDAVVSLRSLHHMDAKAAINEARRVLVKGGAICIADWRFGAETGVPERYFSESEVIDMLYSSGFRAIAIIPSSETDIFIIRAMV